LQYSAGRDALSGLIRNLRSSGYVVIGPKVYEGAVCLGEIESAQDLAAGVVDVQAPGKYRLAGSSDLIFSAVNGPHSPKTFLHPSEVDLLKLKGGLAVESTFKAQVKYAFLGVRACDLKAIQVLDRALMMPQYRDPVYTPLRESSIVVVVNCGRSGENCFCASMGTGPKAEAGYDLAITELPGGLLIDVPKGREGLLAGIELKPASAEEIEAERDLMDEVSSQMKRHIDREGPADFMYGGIDSPVWDDVAQRCLSCGNCTMVCPTCFCNILQDRTELTDGSVSRVRVWDSCLSKNFTYSAGGNPRLERKARYRQFVMHKFAYWTDQFKLYGCVGCGRCITWCPVGIDITDTVNRVLKGQGDKRPLPEVVKVA
jgi:sulfhydrogenase subunit beta (sulfur reductase)